VSTHRSPFHNEADTFPASEPLACADEAGVSPTTASKRVPEVGAVGESEQAVPKMLTAITAVMSRIPCVRLQHRDQPPERPEVLGVELLDEK
jgi:hypothetical protein